MPLNLETLAIIFPYAISLSIVGIVESLLTAYLIDKINETPNHKNKETAAEHQKEWISALLICQKTRWFDIIKLRLNEG